MEKKSSQREITIYDEMHDLEPSTQEIPSSLYFSTSKCCIYKVPEFIRKDKKECYQPLVISIGPVFYNKCPEFETMQELKMIYKKAFLQHPKNACRNFDRYKDIIRGLEGDIRDSYQEKFSISCDGDANGVEFIEIIVLDAVFLLYLFIDNYEDNVDPSLLDYHPKKCQIPKKLNISKLFMDVDIFLEENQIPFFVLKHIFDISFPHLTFFPSLMVLTKEYIGNQVNIPGAEHVAETNTYVCDASNIAHLVDFWWKYCCSSICTQEYSEVSFPMTAKQLSDAGVKFKYNGKSKNPLVITFNDDDGVFEIPKFTVGDGTETFLRSILFFEQCHYYCENHTPFIDWVVFLDKLIDTKEDIQILVKQPQEEILTNLLGSDDEAAKLFNKINKNLIYSENFKYSRVSNKVNAYANKSWNRWRAILKRDYFSHPWAILSVIFAIILFILSVLQTIAGFTNK